MKCYHACPLDYDFSAWHPREFHYLKLPYASPQRILAVHGEAHDCPDPSTALPHVLAGTQVGAQAAAILSEFGVSATDTVGHAAVKVGRKIPAFMP